MEDELEIIRKRKLLELQKQLSQEEESKEIEDQKKLVLRQILTTEARERLGRIKVARPEIVEAIENQLIALSQSGRLKNKINDEQLKELLIKLFPKKREIRIRRRGL
jgi:programmed cell death protein 5